MSAAGRHPAAAAASLSAVLAPGDYVRVQIRRSGLPRKPEPPEGGASGTAVAALPESSTGKGLITLIGRVVLVDKEAVQIEIGADRYATLSAEEPSFRQVVAASNPPQSSSAAVGSNALRVIAQDPPTLSIALSAIKGPLVASLVKTGVSASVGKWHASLIPVGAPGSSPSIEAELATYDRAPSPGSVARDAAPVQPQQQDAEMAADTAASTFQPSTTSSGVKARKSCLRPANASSGGQTTTTTATTFHVGFRGADAIDQMVWCAFVGPTLSLAMWHRPARTLMFIALAGAVYGWPSNGVGWCTSLLRALWLFDFSASSRARRLAATDAASFPVISAAFTDHVLFVLRCACGLCFWSSIPLSDPRRPCHWDTSLPATPSQHWIVQLTWRFVMRSRISIGILLIFLTATSVQQMVNAVRGENGLTSTNNNNNGTATTTATDQAAIIIAGKTAAVVAENRQRRQAAPSAAVNETPTPLPPVTSQDAPVVKGTTIPSGGEGATTDPSPPATWSSWWTSALARLHYDSIAVAPVADFAWRQVSILCLLNVFNRKL